MAQTECKYSVRDWIISIVHVAMGIQRSLWAAVCFLELLPDILLSILETALPARSVAYTTKDAVMEDLTLVPLAIDGCGIQLDASNNVATCAADNLFPFSGDWIDSGTPVEHLTGTTSYVPHHGALAPCFF